MARSGWLLAVLACACSSPDAAQEETKPSGWLSLTFSQPSRGRQCFPAAATPYEFGTEAHPLTDQVSCSVHFADGDAWFTGVLGDSRTSNGGQNLVFHIGTEMGLELLLVTDLSGTLELDPDTTGCAPLASVLIDNAATADFDCPLLVDPGEPTSGCGVRGTVTFIDCENVEE